MLVSPIPIARAIFIVRDMQTHQTRQYIEAPAIYLSGRVSMATSEQQESWGRLVAR